MPRKLSGMNFEIHPSPMKNSEGKNLLYVRPLQGQQITIDELDEFCSKHAGLPRNTLSTVFNYFCSACAEFLADGRRIKTPMGVFSPRISLKREITDPFKHSPFYDKKKEPLTEAQLQKALEQSIAHLKGHTTVSSFGNYAGLTRHSAQKYLDSLCVGEHPQLKRTLVGRIFIYEKNEL